MRLFLNRFAPAVVSILLSRAFIVAVLAYLTLTYRAGPSFAGASAPDPLILIQDGKSLRLVPVADAGKAGSRWLLVEVVPTSVSVSLPPRHQK